MSQYHYLIQRHMRLKSGINLFTSSKAGVESLTKTLALELADIGIRVNGIAPGIIATNTNQELLDNKEKKKQKESEIPIHRMGQPEEIAKVALFLASNNASYITGNYSRCRWRSFS
jgi:glucose 1-dehydrogenase